MPSDVGELGERACRGRSTLIVVMPIARAGLRLMPRSSRNTAVGASTSSSLEHELVDARVGLAQPDDRRLDDDVEAEPVAVDRGDAVASVRGQLLVSAAVRRPALADALDRARHRGPRSEAATDQLP